MHAHKSGVDRGRGRSKLPAEQGSLLWGSLPGPWQERFNIYFLSNFEVYNTVLLMIITILYIRSPDLIHFIIES